MDWLLQEDGSAILIEDGSGVLLLDDGELLVNRIHISLRVAPMPLCGIHVGAVADVDLAVAETVHLAAQI